MGTVMKSRPQEAKHAMIARFRERWLTPLGRGDITPVIDSVFPLEHVADAHRRMEEGKSVGKIILAIS
jgi:NADPH:quinone reductase-like Zn-dependent oxidoreductase